MRLLAIILLAGVAAPAMAQDHSGHHTPASAMNAQPLTECEAESARHRAMGHEIAPDACPHEPATTATENPRPDGIEMDHRGMDMGQADHSGMSRMGHGPMTGEAMDLQRIPHGPVPAAGGSGPPRAADAIWGAEAMAPSRAALTHENGGQTFAKLLIDRLEYQAHDGPDGYAWEGQAWFGGDFDKFALKSEGEGTFGGEAEQAELQALWSHAIGPWVDLNAGVRHDFAGPERTHLVLGLQGLVPYQFEVDGSVFLSDKGDLTARAEAELDQRITQRLILQPRAEMNFSAQDIPELGVGAGLDRAEVGLRLRYELAREFAPYVGASQEWRIGGSADYARQRGEAVSTTNFVAGVRFWF